MYDISTDMACHLELSAKTSEIIRFFFICRTKSPFHQKLRIHYDPGQAPAADRNRIQTRKQICTSGRIPKYTKIQRKLHYALPSSGWCFWETPSCQINKTKSPAYACCSSAGDLSDSPLIICSTSANYFTGNTHILLNLRFILQKIDHSFHSLSAHNLYSSDSCSHMISQNLW